MYLRLGKFRGGQWTWITIIVMMAGMSSPKALENGIGRTPAMGWNPWNFFLGKVTLELMKESIDSMESKGMREAGYNYVMADGGGGSLMFGPEANIKAFIEYGHSKGFKVGLYCYNARGNEAGQVAKWAGMGFDYLKHDDFNTPWTDPTYTAMRDALKKSGRQVYYTIHPSGFPSKPDTFCNAERVGPDISWKPNDVPWNVTKDNGIGVIGEVMQSRKYQNLAHPGYFNDMDMMAVGIQSLTTEEARTHFGLWCIMSSLLIEGSDIRNIAKDRLEILLNREAIAVNQDSLGEQGRVVWSNYVGPDSSEVISKRMKDSSRAVLLFNRSGSTKSVTVKLSDIGLTGQVHVRDLWRHSNLPDANDSVTIADIPQHGSALLRLSKTPFANVRINTPKATLQRTVSSQAMLNTRLTSVLRLAPRYSGARIYNLEGKLLWGFRQPSNDWASSRGRECYIRIPAILKNIGMVVVRYD